MGGCEDIKSDDIEVFRAYSSLKPTVWFDAVGRAHAFFCHTYLIPERYGLKDAVSYAYRDPLGRKKLRILKYVDINMGM